MQNLVDRVAAHIKARFLAESSGHDWHHINRVWQLTRRIAAQEGADSQIAELGALVHDIADWKFHDGDDSIGPREAAQPCRDGLRIEAMVMSARASELLRVMPYMKRNGIRVIAMTGVADSPLAQHADSIVRQAVLLLRDTWRIVSGQLTDDELVMVQESEDLAAVEELHIDQTPPIGQGQHSMPFRR